MSQLATYAACVGITCVIQWGGFLAAFVLQTETFYDVLGGVNFLCLALYTATVPAEGMPDFSRDPHKLAMTCVFVCSRAWLLLFLAWRARERGGDQRFDGVIGDFCHFLVFWTVQGIWVLAISMPLLVVNSAETFRPRFDAGDWLFMLGFGLGVLLEVVADVQKAVWVKQGRLGGFCRSGLWNYSRHPNYFGEMLQWWCAWGFAYSSASGPSDVLWWCSGISPLFTMQILLNTPETGVAQANGQGLKRYYENPEVAAAYAEYRKNTSILIPLLGYKHVPLVLKRTLLLDLERYEYKPSAQVGDGVVQSLLA